MPAPYDYTIGQVPNPAQSFIQGIQTVDALRQREQQIADAEKARKAQEAFRTMQTEYWNTPNPTLQQTMRLASMLPKDQAEMLFKGVEAQDKAKTQANIALGGQVLSSLLAGNKDTAVNMLRERATAATNSGDQAGSQQWDALAKQIEIAKPEESFKIFAPFMAASGEEGRKMMESVYAAQKQPSEQREAAAKAEEAEIKIKGLQEKQSAELLKAQSEAEQERIKAKYAEQIAIEDLKKKAADRGLTAQQTRQSLASTSKLQTEGRMLKLDFDAALQGLPLPSKGGGQTTVSAATEDERKAAGWLAQATNAYTNMLNAMYTKEGKPTKAEAPGIIETMALEPLKGIVRSPERQQFVQATSSLSEALLRAATGAGVNKEEAAQKVAELTPVWSDDEATKKQKLDAIPMYLQSLQARAGRAAPKDYQVPTAQQRNVVVSY